MSIRHKSEGERARKGRTILKIEERDKETLAIQKSGIIGALGTIGKDFRTCIRKIQMQNCCNLMQKTCLLGTAKIIRKVVDT